MIDVQKLARIGVAKKYKQDEIFFHEGELGQEMYILLTGCAGEFANSVDGCPRSLAKLEPGSFFGEMSLFEQQPRGATVQALDDCLVIILNQDNFEQVISQQPQLAYRILKGMSQGIRQQSEELSKIKKTFADDAVQVAKALHLDPKEEGPKCERSVEVLSLSTPAAEITSKQSRPAEDENFLFDKEISCPVCAQNFTVKMVRSSRLRLSGVDPDLRQRFQQFEPLWYTVWVCPHCSFANFNYEFKQVTEEQKRYVKSASQERMRTHKSAYSVPRKLGEVLDAYGLILQMLMNGDRPDASRVAKVWLRLSWLYQDAGDQENYLQSSRQALAFFSQMYDNSGHNSSRDQEQRVALLLGELSLRTRELKDAGVFFRKAIMHQGGNVIINRQAEDRIQELKQMLRTQD